MAVFDARRSDGIRHAGTFNGHPAALAAGHAALDVLDDETILRMNGLGARLADGIRIVGEQTSLAVTATAYGSIGSIHAGIREPESAREAAELRRPLLALYWELVAWGSMLAPRGQFSISAATTDEQVEGLLAALPGARSVRRSMRA